MRVGVPKEIKVLENRVGLTPASVHELVTHGHDVVVESKAGQGIGSTMPPIARSGATIAANADEVFAVADMIVKVKEPQAQERKRLRPGQILFTYLHLAPDPEQTKDLVASGAICIAYETVTADTADFRCWRRCPKWRGACRSRPARISSRSRMAAAESCWAACPAWRPARSSSWAAASSARTRR